MKLHRLDAGRSTFVSFLGWVGLTLLHPIGHHMADVIARASEKGIRFLVSGSCGELVDWRNQWRNPWRAGPLAQISAEGKRLDRFRGRVLRISPIFRLLFDRITALIRLGNRSSMIDLPACPQYFTESCGVAPGNGAKSSSPAPRTSCIFVRFLALEVDCLEQIAKEITCSISHRVSTTSSMRCSLPCGAQWKVQMCNA